MGTILTGNDIKINEEIALDKKAQPDREAAYLIIKELQIAYEDGEITFEKLCKYVDSALRPKALNMERNILLGKAIRRALRTTPKKRNRGNTGQPKFIREISVGLVKLVRKREGLPKTRESKKPTAFRRVTKIMKKRGLPVTESQVERWYVDSTDK